MNDRMWDFPTKQAPPCHSFIEPRVTGSPSFPQARPEGNKDNWPRKRGGPVGSLTTAAQQARLEGGEIEVPRECPHLKGWPAVTGPEGPGDEHSRQSELRSQRAAAHYLPRL